MELRQFLVNSVRITINILTTDLIAVSNNPEYVSVCARRRLNYESPTYGYRAALGGWRHVAVTDRRTAVDWAHQIRELVDVHYPEAQRITLVMDNLNTHVGASLYKAFKPEEARRILERLEIHYTPKHGSWLNMAEIELSILSRQCLDRRIPDQETMKEEIAAWVSRRNSHSKPMSWRFTTEDARIKLKKLYPTIED